ncbi:DUF6470 family protein [Fictibacillus sp. Mic-4]|uniref:DUF6470 family protein n=1 Tax=Fictibacillus TaxID=1329200 RepID=UPI00041D9C4D|nr:DUF6470 family protein [Fictibacillus gelatini]
MHIPQLRMESTKAQVQLTITKPIQEMEQPPAELSIEQPKAELKIDRTPGKLTIDQTKAWEDMDLKHIFRRIEEFAQNGHRDWLEGIARRARQGDELMRIENGGNPIKAQAKENSEKPVHEFNIGFIPSPFSVKTNYEPGRLDIEWETYQKPVINVQVHQPKHNYTPGTVHVEMKQWPSLKIEVSG